MEMSSLCVRVADRVVRPRRRLALIPLPVALQREDDGDDDGESRNDAGNWERRREQQLSYRRLSLVIITSPSPTPAIYSICTSRGTSAKSDIVC